MSGAGFGGLVLAPATKALMSGVGLRWTLRLLGLLNLLITFPIGFVMKSKDGRVGSLSLVNLRVAKRKAFIFEVVFRSDDADWSA